MQKYNFYLKFSSINRLFFCFFALNMILKKIHLINYKNFASAEFNFNTKINCFIGNNGVGKTNVLDAIYYLSFTKGYFNSIASQHIKHNENFFLIEGIYQSNKKEFSVHCSLKKGHKKLVKKNGKAYEKLSEHIGTIPLVIISPYDRNLISEGSETRRKFVDSVMSQSDIQYLNNLLKYNKLIAQRNSLLKYFASNHTFDALNLSVYNEQIIPLGETIHDKRKQFLNEFTPIFKQRYFEISGGNETVDILYKSQLNEYSFSDLIKKNIQKDRITQYSTQGIHKDDLIFTIDNYPVKKFGSQGQQKSFLIALKLAQFDFIKKQSEKKPILLLDDIFDKLDDNRVSQLIELVNNSNFGQIFITDTHQERTENIIKKTNQKYQFFKL
jgi:DNA replication and repair protein RecF